MKAVSLRAAPLVLLLAAGLGLAAAPAVKKTPDSDVQEFVFLGEARPVLIRLHVRVDGKTAQQAHNDFLKSLFAYLDVDGDGVLSKDEAERVPSISQIRRGGLPSNGRGTRDEKRPKLKDLDLNGDGKVTLEELAAYYRNNGMKPFQVQLSSEQPNPFAAMAMFGMRQDPTADEISQAIFKRLDTNGDGKLSKEELAAAPRVLLALDENEDDLVTLRELVPSGKSSGNMFGMMMGGPKTKGPAGKQTLLSLTTPGEAPPGLARSMKERYGPRGKLAEKIRLNRKELGLDEPTFSRLDDNRDGVLDESELNAFVKRPPDLELVVRLGSTTAGQAPIDLVWPKYRSSALGGKVKVTGDLAVLDLGLTRAEVRRSEAEDDGYGIFESLIRQQILALFSGADKDGKGYITQKQADSNPLFRGQFKAMDRDGDGKLTLKEVNAYFDAYRKLQTQATEGCVSLVFADESRGLFDLLDVNGDRQLSLREMRGAVGLLTQLDRAGKGYLTRGDIPRSYQLTLRRGVADQANNESRAFALLYGGGAGKRERKLTAGPAWFRKMDRNRDGDVSRKEFLFSDELFRKIDTDGDGLISAEEAERYDALLRKQK